eukprot:CAMPEP_0114579180 /NCGR_PEP_ID=MMETSP0125-20121206/3601_1 /TAXON_ID=485358 ORGANISM="Aristerostoma sp., Strain ATCC 50986" /NCGR_SAMPLE_ID=MMETSP0125 /ASSEMBLY_ACC=CAM_ASM_000245 /LENGTH=41 /DNA_ID= /DNA_START= /DNA_END= /DNA_ORIENTATION=
MSQQITEAYEFDFYFPGMNNNNSTDQGFDNHSASAYSTSET